MSGCNHRRLGLRAELLDEPRAEERGGGVAQRFRIRHEVIAEAIVQRRVVRLDEPTGGEVIAEQVEIDQRNARAAQDVLHRENLGVEHESALDVEPGEAGLSHELRPEMPARQSLHAHVHELVVTHERFEVLAGVPRFHVRMTGDAETHGPQQVADALRDRRSRVQHRDIDVGGGRPDAVGADEIDFDFRVIGSEILQQRHHHVRGEARRHLHSQGAQPWRAGVADFVDRMFEPIERP